MFSKIKNQHMMLHGKEVDLSYPMVCKTEIILKSGEEINQPFVYVYSIVGNKYIIGCHAEINENHYVLHDIDHGQIFQHTKREILESYSIHKKLYNAKLMHEKEFLLIRDSWKNEETCTYTIPFDFLVYMNNQTEKKLNALGEITIEKGASIYEFGKNNQESLVSQYINHNYCHLFFFDHILSYMTPETITNTDSKGVGLFSHIYTSVENKGISTLLEGYVWKSLYKHAMLKNN